jgi:hypothetical protein
LPEWPSCFVHLLPNCTLHFGRRARRTGEISSAISVRKRQWASWSSKSLRKETSSISGSAKLTPVRVLGCASKPPSQRRRARHSWEARYVLVSPGPCPPTRPRGYAWGGPRRRMPANLPAVTRGGFSRRPQRDRSREGGPKQPAIFWELIPT